MMEILVFCQFTTQHQPTAPSSRANVKGTDRGNHVDRGREVVVVVASARETLGLGKSHGRQTLQASTRNKALPSTRKREVEIDRIIVALY